ncbi:MAG: hypothetical protein ACEPOV_04905 [Hyphomicrobiales bacterium]
MALDSYKKRHKKKGKTLRIRLKEEQYKYFLQYCRTQDSTPVRYLKKKIKESLEEYLSLKEDGVIPDENQLLLFEDLDTDVEENIEALLDEEQQLNLFE